MLRFPNPGSDISSFIRIFQVLFKELNGNKSFTLDDMSSALVANNLATSCGFMGASALERSTRADRSRDPLYNQSKMYSELFRTLGWIQPQPKSRLVFGFTYLGAHMAEAHRDPDALFGECILGIAYPNQVLDIKGAHKLRPFVCILRAMQQLDRILCRDEMIIGPLSIVDDRDGKAFDRMILEIRTLRGNWRRLTKAMASLSRRLKISENTMGNYTRFPLAVLEWSGWTQKERRKDIYGKPIIFHKLTDRGTDTLAWLSKAVDFRAADLRHLRKPLAEALVRFGQYSMLERAGFDVGPISELMEADREVLKAGKVLGGTTQVVLFSPFQELSPQLVQDQFPQIEVKSDGILSARAIKEAGVVSRKVSYHVLLKSKKAKMPMPAKDGGIARLLMSAYKSARGNTQNAVEMLAKKYEGANRSVFYPLVVGLLRSIGYDCELTRAGVNYQRWDALIQDKENSIPVEIKSPGEEPFLSVKSVRQALENKVVLLARKHFRTKLETTSLVVGYNLPNDRSEVLSLIADVHKSFGFFIGVIDFRSLLRLAIASLVENKQHDDEALRNLHGIIEVTNS